MNLKKVGPVRGLEGIDGRFVGLDLSLTGTGLALVDGGLAYLAELNPGKRRGPERLAWIRDQIIEFMRKAEPDLAAVEGYSYGSKGSQFDMGEIGGIARVLLWEHGYDYRLVPPASLKLFVSGKGNSPKEIMLRDVFARWGITTDSHNEADAAALAIVAACLTNPSADILMSGPQRTALEKIEEIRR